METKRHVSYNILLNHAPDWITNAGPQTVCGHESPRLVCGNIIDSKIVW